MNGAPGFGRGLTYWIKMSDEPLKTVSCKVPLSIHRAVKQRGGGKWLRALIEAELQKPPPPEVKARLLLEAKLRVAYELLPQWAEIAYCKHEFFVGKK